MKKVILGLGLVLGLGSGSALQAGDDGYVGSLNFSALQSTLKYMKIEESAKYPTKFAGTEFQFLPNSSSVGIMTSVTGNGVLPMKMQYRSGTKVYNFPRLSDDTDKIQIETDGDTTVILADMVKTTKLDKVHKECYLSDLIVVSKSAQEWRFVSTVKVCVHYKN